MCFRPPSWRCKRLWRVFCLRVRSAYLRPRFAALHGPFRVPAALIFEENFMSQRPSTLRPLGENAETMFQMVAAIVCFVSIGVLLAL